MVKCPTNLGKLSYFNNLKLAASHGDLPKSRLLRAQGVGVTEEFVVVHGLQLHCIDLGADDFMGLHGIIIYGIIYGITYGIIPVIGC